MEIYSRGNPAFLKGGIKLILITGANGQLGTELCHLLDENGIPYVGTTVEKLDITNQTQVQTYINEIKPTVIYHCAAYTAVDKAEDEGKELNYLVNVEGTRNVALAAKQVGAIFVYISTDYVFDGKKQGYKYTTEDKPNPQNEYGKAKLAGEEVVQELLERYFIIRTSWVFGKYGNNFVYTMQKLAESKDRLTIVNDQLGRPTWTRTLAEFMSFVIEKNVPFGIYHLSNEGSCTWYEFAKEILKDSIDTEVVPVTSREFPQKAKRPQYSVMDISRTSQLGFELLSWKEVLRLSGI